MSYLESKAMCFIVFFICSCAIFFVIVFLHERNKRKIKNMKYAGFVQSIKDDVRYEHDEIIREKLSV